jgi:hypothetical protein
MAKSVKSQFENEKQNLLKKQMTNILTMEIALDNIFRHILKRSFTAEQIL